MTCYTSYSAHYQQQATASEPDAMAQLAASAPAVQTHRSRRTSPAYLWIRVGSGLLAATGIVSIVGGLFILLLGIGASAKSNTNGEAAGTAVASTILAVSLIVYGLMFMYFASLGMAVRDIARNSFRW